MSAKDATKEFDADLEQASEKISVGDLVRDTIIISESPEEVYVGIVIAVKREGYEEQLHFTKPSKPPILRKPDKCTVYWFAGERSGEQEIVPDWFLKVLSKADDI